MQAKGGGDPAQWRGVPHPETVGHNPHEEVPDIANAELIRFLGTDPAETTGQ